METTSPLPHCSSLEMLESRIAPASVLVAAGKGQVFLYSDADGNGTYEVLTDSFAPFLNYKGGISVAMGDFDGDGNDELAVAKTGVTNAAVRLYDVMGAGKIGALAEELIPFRGTKNKGVSVGTGDLDGDGRDELIVGSGPGDRAEVKIYSDTDRDSLLGDELIDTAEVFAAPFKGGVRVAAGDVDNDGNDEVVVAQAKAGGTVATFNDANVNRSISDDNGGAPVETFTPFGEKFRGGLTVASGQISNFGGNGAEIIVGNAKGLPKVLIFGDANSNGKVADDPILDTLEPAAKGFTSGAAVAAGDTDHSGVFIEVITGPNAGSGSHVKIFDDTNDDGPRLSDNALPFEFDAIAKGSGGLNLAFGRIRTATAAAISIPRALADNATTQVNFTVEPGAGTIGDLNVALSLNHTFNADLDITLTHVSTGKTMTLFTDVGNNDHGFFIVLDDQAGTDIAAATDDPNNHALAGTFRPESPALLSAFNGESLSGQWRLTIVDDSANDFGTLFDLRLIATLQF